MYPEDELEASTPRGLGDRRAPGTLVPISAALGRELKGLVHARQGLCQRNLSAIRFVFETESHVWEADLELLFLQHPHPQFDELLVLQHPPPKC